MVSFFAIPVAYLIGSIPFGYLIVKLTGRGDVRETGSGGTGATNVSRRAGKRAGVVTLILDALKGVVAMVVATMMVNPNWVIADWLIAASAVATIVGHIFPVWLGFRGGKGVATAVGVFAVIAPLALLCAGVVFVAVVWLTRYVSLASLTAAASIPLVLLLEKLFAKPVADVTPVLTAALVGALLIVFAHRGNIARLMKGTEPKFS